MAEKPGPTGQVQELKTLVVGYAKQETIEPMKLTGQKVAWGMAGAVFVALGSVFLVLATLRGFQQLGPFNHIAAENGGKWSFAPHLIAAVVGITIIAVCAKLIAGSTKKPPIGSAASKT